MLPPPPFPTQNARARIAVNRALGLCLILAAITPAWGAIAIDQTKSTDRSTASASITSPSFSTTAANELLLAFISTDAKSAGITVTGVTTTGLTWVLVRRTNAQLGTAEVWRAFAPTTLAGVTVRAALSQSVAASITVVTFTGTDSTGSGGSGAIGNTASASASSGAPTASLVTTRNGSWVFGVGNDWANATARTPGAGQILTHQYLASVGDTYWVQQQAAPTPTSGTNVIINDTAPTVDRYNLTLVEVLSAVTGPTFAVSGTASPTNLVSGASVVLRQNGNTVATTTIDGTGAYNFPSVANGTYTVTPTQSAVNFNPTTQNVTVSGGPATVPPFTATQQTVSGTATPLSLVVGASVVLSRSGTTPLTATVDSTGAYSFVGVPNGTYTVTPSQSSVVFAPTSQTANVNGANFTVPVFTASPQLWTVSGAVNPTNSGVGTLLSLDGTASDGTTAVHLTATAGANGAYSIPNVPNGSYTATPTKNGYTFTPPSASVNINNANGTANFLAAPIATYTISGTISPASGGTGALLTLSGSPSTTTTADTNGFYSFPGLGNNSYTITPSRSGYTFTPPSQTVVVSGTDMPNINFTAQQQQGPPLNYPDLSVMVPAGKISIVGSGTNRALQYTHDTYEGGSGPLVIQPSYNPATGNYQGLQNIYLFSGGRWTLALQLPIAGVFIFDSDHGHFHFPLASFGLYTVAANGGIGTAVALSPKISHCIADSFLFNSSLPNAGWPGNLGPCTNPTAPQGIDIGYVDEYDQNDAGQSISIGSVPDGAYWLKILIDPDNYLFESNKANNETDTQLTIAGNRVTVLQTVTPVLAPPPSITLTSPADLAAVSGTVSLNASTATTTGVQFLLDGSPLGTLIASQPYTFNWDSTTVPNGSHWLAAQTTDGTGIIGTSPVARLTVANNGSKPPVVTVSNPPDGSTVSATIILGATVADANPVTSVQFFVDGTALGAPLTAAPYLAFWDTLGLANGTHTLTASAIDSLGLSATSPTVTVTVDNSHPANTIGIDATVFTDASNIMTSPPFSTTTPSDLLVAFVAYDGPSNAAQTATVSGAGLPWTLLERSNTQHGTAEIWASKASDFLTNATVIAQPGSSGHHGSLVVVAFTNAAGPGIVNRAGGPSGAPDVFIPGVAAGDWVFAVGNDWDRAVARTPVSGQILVHQQVDTSGGNTFWVQSTTGPSTASALVDIHDTAPTNDKWNYAAVEIVATRQ